MHPLLPFFPSVGGKQAAINEAGRVKERSDVEKISKTKKVWKETEDRNRSVITRELTPPDLFSLNLPLLFAIPPRIKLAGAV